MMGKYKLIVITNRSPIKLATKRANFIIPYVYYTRSFLVLILFHTKHL